MRRAPSGSTDWKQVCRSGCLVIVWGVWCVLGGCGNLEGCCCGAKPAWVWGEVHGAVAGEGCGPSSPAGPSSPRTSPFNSTSPAMVKYAREPENGDKVAKVREPGPGACPRSP
jgi:hypothetical protein